MKVLLENWKSFLTEQEEPAAQVQQILQGNQHLSHLADKVTPDTVKDLKNLYYVQFPGELGSDHIKKHFDKTQQHPIAKKIIEIREYNKANTTFIETILQHQYKGRIHCEFNQLRSSDGGTVTGRFSSSHPNLQQVPARHPEIKEMIRGLFIPEEGCEWGSFDYTAQEPRWLMHYA